MMYRDHEWHELRTIDGELDRPFVTAGWWLPSAVELHGTRLVWAGQSRIAHPGPGMFEGFLALGTKTVRDEDIAKYARRWGILRICRHGLPFGHIYPRPPDGVLKYTGMAPVWHQPDCRWWNIETSPDG